MHAARGEGSTTSPSPRPSGASWDPPVRRTRPRPPAPVARDRLHVSQLWRYPVKSLGAEPLGSARSPPTASPATASSTSAAPRPLTGRSRHELLAVPAAQVPMAPTVAATPGPPSRPPLIRAHAGPDSRLAPTPVPSASTCSTSSSPPTAPSALRPRRPPPAPEPPHLWGARRCRATWPGRALPIGDVLVGIQLPRGRCPVTTIDPDSGVHDVEVLRRHPASVRRQDRTRLLGRPARHDPSGHPAQLVTTATSAPRRLDRRRPLPRLPTRTGPQPAGMKSRYRGRSRIRASRQPRGGRCSGRISAHAPTHSAPRRLVADLAARIAARQRSPLVGLTRLARRRPTSDGTRGRRATRAWRARRSARRRWARYASRFSAALATIEVGRLVGARRTGRTSPYGDKCLPSVARRSMIDVSCRA